MNVRGNCPSNRLRLGFTMTELMVCVVVVAILATVAVPVHRKYVRYSRVSEATTRIGEIVTAAKAYAQAHPNAAGNPIWPPAAGREMVNLANSPYFRFAITGGANQNALNRPLTIRATGIAGRKMAGVTITVTVANIRSSGSKPTITGL